MEFFLFYQHYHYLWKTGLCNKHNAPPKIYNEMHSKASAEGNNARIAVGRPKDLKQIKNIKYSEDFKE